MKSAQGPNRHARDYRWSFDIARDGSWKWKQMNEHGLVLREADGAFDTLAACLQNAEAHGYASQQSQDVGVPPATK
jgi:hypothetical protein